MPLVLQKTGDGWSQKHSYKQLSNEKVDKFLAVIWWWVLIMSPPSAMSSPNQQLNSILNPKILAPHSSAPCYNFFCSLLCLFVCLLLLLFFFCRGGLPLALLIPPFQIYVEPPCAQSMHSRASIAVEIKNLSIRDACMYRVSGRDRGKGGFQPAKS